MQQPKIIELNGQKYDAKSGKKVSATQEDGSLSPSQKSTPKIGPKHTGLVFDGIARRGSSLKHSIGNSRTVQNMIQKKPSATQNESNKVKPTSIKRFGDISTKTDTRTNKSFFKKTTSTQPASPPAYPPALVNKSHSSAGDIFKEGLRKAQSHTEEVPSKPPFSDRLSEKLRISKRTMFVSLAAAVIVSAVGLTGYHYMPKVALEFAAHRTGVRASLPAYSPSGFNLQQPISYGDDEINLEYKSLSDDRYFKVTQKASSWDSRALLENFVATNQKQYQTMQVKGRTIYTYNNGDATWVDGGTMYKIEGNSNLSSDQLLKIIDGL